MTNQEAISWLRTTTSGAEQLCECEKEAIKMAIEALEKQIPKKPYLPVNIDLRSNRIDGCCPNCDARQHCGGLSWHKWFNKVCYECGQALDWDLESKVTDMSEMVSGKLVYKTYCKSCGYTFNYGSDDIEEDGKIACPFCFSRCTHMPSAATISDKGKAHITVSFDDSEVNNG